MTNLPGVVADAVLNTPVPNHDENPDDNVAPDSYAYKSYGVMANWRASKVQGDVAGLKSDVADIKKTLAALTAAVAALPKG